MRELIEEILSQARSAWRFRWWGVAVAWGVAAFGFVAVAVQEDVYEANTRIYVDTSSDLRPLLGEQIVDSDVATRLVYVRQALLGRDYLQQVVAENSLDAEAADETEREYILTQLADDVYITAVSPTPDGNFNRQDSSMIFTISYRHPDPETAVGVVESFKNILMADTLRSGQQGTEGTEAFFEREIGFYDDLLEQAQAAKLDFLKVNSQRLPGSEAGIQTRIQRERELVDSLGRDLMLAESGREELEKQLRGESAIRNIGDATGVDEPSPNSIDGQLRQLMSRRQELLLRYTPQHPEVIAVNEAISQLEARRALELQALGITNLDQELSSLGNNPVFESIRIAIYEADLRISQLRAERNDRLNNLAELNSQIDEVLEVESRASELDLDINHYYEKRRELVEARERQRLSGQAASSDQVEFNVLNPPMAGTSPVAPQRFLLLMTVFAAALGGGGGICWLRAQLKPVFTSSRSLREITGIPVFGTVRQVKINSSRKATRILDGMAIAGAMACLVVVFGGAAMIEVMGPGVLLTLGVR